MYEYLGRFLKSEKFETHVLSSLRANVKYWEEQIPVEVSWKKTKIPRIKMEFQNL